MSNDTNELGNFLRGLRGTRSLREVSKMTGLSFGYYRELELGYDRTTKKRVNPSIDSLKKISRTFSISLEVLLEKAGIEKNSHIDDTDTAYKTRYELPVETQKVVAMFESLDHETKKVFIEMLKAFQKK